MMKARKLLALVAAMTAAAAVMAACGGGTNAGSGSDSKTLTLASVDQGSVEDVVKAFEAANPGVKVQFTTGGADQYTQQIRTQLSSGTAPDVMTIWLGNGNAMTIFVAAKNGYLLDLSDRPWASKQPDAVKTVSQYNGKTYTGIFGINGIGAIYNQQAMDKAGLSPPTTWTELMAFCTAAAGKGTPAFALGIQDLWVTQIVQYALVATVVYADDRDFDKQMQAGQATFANSPWTTAMAKYIEMDKAGCFQKNPLGTSYEASQDLAATGKTLGIVQGNWVVALLKNKNPNGTFVMKGAAGHRPAGEVHHARRGRRRLRGQRQGEEQGPCGEVRRLRDVAGGDECVQQEAGQPPVPARHRLRRRSVACRTVEVHQRRPNGAVHGSALAQPQGGTEHDHRDPGNLQRTVHIGQGADQDGHRLPGRQFLILFEE
jgi:raffinose/stachyose/melibiose transport system substrate-binding protein